MQYTGAAAAAASGVTEAADATAQTYMSRKLSLSSILSSVGVVGIGRRPDVVTWAENW